MSLTREEIVGSGYKLQAAPEESWRTYDEADPIPGYFQFDWLSSRHPDLYHAFALSSVGLIQKLHTLIDLTGREVLDILEKNVDASSSLDIQVLFLRS